jgi:alpha-L-rhamnosidase
MKNKKNDNPGFSFSWHRLLRRTLVRPVRYSAGLTPTLSKGEGHQQHSSGFSKTLLLLLQCLNGKTSVIKKTFKPSGSVHQQAPFRGFGCFRFFVLLCIFASLRELSHAQQATWIWYPGDYEIWLSNQMQNRRTDRDTFFPVFWKVDNHYPLMDFHKVFELKEAEEVSIYAEGQYNVKLDGKPLEGTPHRIIVPAGKHRINVKVFCQRAVPAIYIKGKTIVSDGSWLTTFEDKEWIDETGKTSDISATQWLNAGYWNFNDPVNLPSTFKLPVTPQQAVLVTKNGNAQLVDFGKETFGFVKLHGLKGKGDITIYYGESKEEALSKDAAITFDRLSIDNASAKDSVMELSKAFRYVNIVPEGNVQMDAVSMLYEYADLKDKGSFTCSDDEINRIYDVAKYTLHLSTREFFIDGIKRDRWIWSGDAYQSYLMNYYLMNDNATVTRTMYALRGKDPVTGHINTIMDYTFYWFLGIYDYYLYTGDKTFILQNYGRMQTLMDYVLGRRNKDGLLEGLPGDWIFIDWAAGLSKKGEVSFEQLLFARSLETMALCANIVNDKKGALQYKAQASDIRKKLFEIYWNDQKKALVHSRVNGKQTDQVTRYANMFAIFFDYFNQQQKQAVKQSVLLNNDIQKITTPYMRFYELEALCAMGEQNYVLKEMKAYWGGMLKLGATSFWEEYNPDKKGAEHYAMYGRAFGKSLCHAWGASPIYLLGKYYLGIKPTSPGYATYVIEPSLGGLQWMQGKVPTPGGDIEIHVSKEQLKIKAAAGIGTLKLKSKSLPTGKNLSIKQVGNEVYEIQIQPGMEYVINYKNSF